MGRTRIVDPGPSYKAPSSAAESQGYGLDSDGQILTITAPPRAPPRDNSRDDIAYSYIVSI